MFESHSTFHCTTSLQLTAKSTSPPIGTEFSSRSSRHRLHVVPVVACESPSLQLTAELDEGRVHRLAIEHSLAGQLELIWSCSTAAPKGTTYHAEQVAVDVQC